MSSWLSKGVSRKRIRTGYFQDTPAGTFIQKDLPATVVSAYYEMASKYPLDSYRQWIRNFLENCECYLVFFCEEDLAPFIAECRKEYTEKTDIIVLPREEWIANKEFNPRFWKDQFLNDPEANIHSPDLYKVWFEKKEFVRRAIVKNPFGHTDFVWCDAGFCRSEGLKSLIKDFPNANRIPTDKILFNNIGEFTERDSDDKIINGVSLKTALGKMRIAGSCMAASKSLWQRYSKAYDSVMETFFKAGLFLGMDQNIMSTLVLEHPYLVSLVEPPQCISNPLFYLQVLLAAPKPLFEFLTDKKTSLEKRSFEELYTIAYPRPPQPQPSLTNFIEQFKQPSRISSQMVQVPRPPRTATTVAPAPPPAPAPAPVNAPTPMSEDYWIQQGLNSVKAAQPPLRTPNASRLWS
jgi:hypothetical protein